MRDIEIPWSDNWYIENDKAWFCAGEICALFCVDMNTLQCELVAWIPECNMEGVRRYPYCLKYKNTVFCLPISERDIWCYDINEKTWEKVELGSEKYLVMCMVSFRQDVENIWLLEAETGRLFKVNAMKKKLEREYYIPPSGDDYVGEYTLVGNKLYCVSGQKIYCIEDDDIIIYDEPIVKGALSTICYDGINFWLTGDYKEIYVWNPQRGIVKIITEFSKLLGLYHFEKKGDPFLDYDSFSSYSTNFSFFVTSASLEKYVWFIPYCSNSIIYIDRNTYKVFVLDLEEECETKESMENHFMNYKFLFEYIREDRYIGLYSTKNRGYFEIDTKEICVRKRIYELSDRAILSLALRKGDYKEGSILREHKKLDRRFFTAKLKMENEKTGNLGQNIGEHIFQILDSE